MSSQQPYKVAIVLDKSYGSKLLDLSSKVHVWIVDTPENKPWIKQIHSSTKPSLESGATSFPCDDNDTPEQQLLDIISDVDLHHGQYSHKPPWSVIEVIGANLSDQVEKEFKETFGITEFERSPNGFTAKKVL